MAVWTGDEPDVRAWVNADQAAGAFRVRYAELFDAEARLHEQRLHAAANVGAAEHVLELARRLTDREGLRNVSYRLADAQVAGLGRVH